MVFDRQIEIAAAFEIQKYPMTFFCEVLDRLLMAPPPPAKTAHARFGFASKIDSKTRSHQANFEPMHWASGKAKRWAARANGVWLSS